MTFLLFAAGLALLLLGADLLVRGASRLSLSLGIPPLVVGLTVVAFGTSAPELAISIGAALDGKTDLALGNVVGSNIFNVLFILGLSALVAPLVVDRQLVRQEVPMMIGLSLLVLAMAQDGRISMPDGVVLVVLMLAYTALLFWQGRRAPPAEMTDALLPAAPGWLGRTPVQVALMVVGLAMLVLGSRWLVQAATEVAIGLGISPLVVGLTIVSAGTSLPEVATSVIAAARGEREIAVGNVLGSCIFNLVAVLGISSLFADGGLQVPPALLAFDLPVMTAVAVACLPVLFTGHLVARWEGVMFLAYYVAYTAWLVMTARDDALRDEFGMVMRLVVLPLTVATLGAIAWREWRARHGDRRTGGDLDGSG